MSSSNGPSKHLSWKELACKDGTPYPEEWRKERAIQLAEVFELIRSECENKPIIVASAYRTKSWNKKIGGTPNSQHLVGKALDLKPPKGYSVEAFFKIIDVIARAGTAIKGIGIYPTFVHVDIRNRENIIYWGGAALKDDN